MSNRPCRGLANTLLPERTCFVLSPRVRLVARFAVLMLATLNSRGDDWPQWRGPNRDGVWPETGILETIPPDGLKIRWRARVGNGYSGPAVARGRVYVTDH